MTFGGRRGIAAAVTLKATAVDAAPTQSAEEMQKKLAEVQKKYADSEKRAADSDKLKREALARAADFEKKWQATMQRASLSEKQLQESRAAKDQAVVSSAQAEKARVLAETKAQGYVDALKAIRKSVDGVFEDA